MTVDLSQGLLNALIYMGVPSVIAIFIGLYVWDKTCRTRIKVLEVMSTGGSTTHYVPREGGSVTIANKELGETRTWPISELATIPMPYPEIGLLPKFLQREIQTVILIEGDWEPLLNRSPHRKKIMSPDSVLFIRALRDRMVEERPDMAQEIDTFLDGVATGPTRELIGDPAVLGALKVSSVMKALASVSDDLISALKQIRDQLARFAGLNATYVYIGLGLVVVMQAFVIYFLVRGAGAPPDAVSPPADAAEIINKLESIRKALGVK